jgi:tRNA(His) guanylyltransferase
MKDSLGDRMKSNYENAFRFFLPRRLPLIIRVDGKAFHSYTAKHCTKDWPVDGNMGILMAATAEELCKTLQGVQFAYVQSEEISLFVHSYKKLTSEPLFGNNKQKIDSISASTASVAFSLNAAKIGWGPGLFDGRCWVMPEAEVCNYFIWRQQDATRNSVSQFARHFYSANQLHGKNRVEMMDMMFEKGLNWNSLLTWEKRGFCVVRSEKGWTCDHDIPIFSQDRAYIEKHLATENET